MTTLFTSDLHLFHNNIIKYCNRPFKNADRMWNTIKRNWNSTVEQNDQVWIVGDLTLKTGSYKSILAKMLGELKGEKHLVIGNHDLMRPKDYEDIGIASVHYPGIYLTFGYEQYLVAHDYSLANILTPGQSLICGHQHGTLFDYTLNKKGNFMIDVGVDVWNFTPISIDMIKKLEEDLRKVVL